MILTVWLVVPPNTVQSLYVTSWIVEVSFHSKLVLQNIKIWFPYVQLLSIHLPFTHVQITVNLMLTSHWPTPHSWLYSKAYICLITVTGSSHTHIHDILAIYCNFRRWSKLISVSTWITICVSPKCIKTWWKCLQVPISICLSFNHITYQCM